MHEARPKEFQDEIDSSALVLPFPIVQFGTRQKCPQVPEDKMLPTGLVGFIGWL